MIQVEISKLRYSATLAHISFCLMGLEAVTVFAIKVTPWVFGAASRGGTAATLVSLVAVILIGYMIGLTSYCCVILATGPIESFITRLTEAGSRLRGFEYSEEWKNLVRAVLKKAGVEEVPEGKESWGQMFEILKMYFNQSPLLIPYRMSRTLVAAGTTLLSMSAVYPEIRVRPVLASALIQIVAGLLMLSSASSAEGGLVDLEDEQSAGLLRILLRDEAEADSTESKRLTKAIQV